MMKAPEAQGRTAADGRSVWLEARRAVGGCALLAALPCSWSCAVSDDVERPRPSAEIVAPGVVSTELPEFGFTVTPDGSEAYFDRASADRSELAIFVARRSDAGWQAAEMAPFSGEHRDLDPFISPDGSVLLFSSERPKEAGSPPSDFDIWAVRREGPGWGRPERLAEEINTAASQFFVSMSRGGVVYYDEADELGRRVVRAVPDGEGGYSKQILSGTALPEGASNPLVSPDEAFLVFAAPGAEGGSSDLFVVLREEEGWSEPIALIEPVRSPFADFAPGLSPDGATLFFTSERPGVAGPVEEGRPPGDVYGFPVEALPIPPAAP